MKKSTLILAALLSVSTVSFAQFKLTDYTSIGSKVLIDSLNGKPTGNNTFVVTFNSNVATSAYSATTFSKGTCRTYKGLQVKTYTYTSLDSTKTIDGAFDCNSYTAQRNPGHVADVDSLKNWLNKAYSITASSTSAGDTTKYGYWKPAACLFNKALNDTTDLVFASYPGMYKRVEYGFYVDLASSGLSLKSDISFDIDTYDAGNTGKTASYKLEVYIGGINASNLDTTISDFYITGSGKKTVNIAEAIGQEYTYLSNKKIYIFLKTIGTEGDMSVDKMDPIISFDDIQFSYGTAKWVSPAVTADQIYNENGAGTYTPYTMNGTLATGQLYLSGEGRLSALTIEDKALDGSKVYSFMSANGVFANDGNGNYTVPVTYTYSPDTMNLTSGSYSLAKIVIPAPTSGSANDDIKVLFTFTPKASAETLERFEITNGIRFWWDIQTKSVSDWTSINNAETGSLTAYTNSGVLYIKGVESAVSIYNVMGQKTGTFTAAKAAEGIQISNGLYLVSSKEGVLKVLVK
jgi:hypothetical protein